MNKSYVYFTKDISSEGLKKIYNALNCNLKGNVGIKISTGELGGHNYLDPSLIKDLVKELNGTLVECNTAYAGKRMTNEDHMETIKAHGFLEIAPCDIMDFDGDMEIPVNYDGHLKNKNIVGTHLKRYDSMLILSHFKGHAMGGFGGALKNMSIGVASKRGKAWIHTAGITCDINDLWNHIDNQDAFLESMAEADKAVIDYFKKENMAYINIANKISIDCDCDSNPKEPELADIGIFASLDPVALDQCCYDTIINSKDPGASSLINRMKEKNAVHILESAEKLKLGNRTYEIIDID